MQSKAYAIIICGGSGTRLWPRSRSGHPKHLLKLDGGRTLVQETVDRLQLPLEQVVCVTESSHDDILREQLPDVPAENIVVEPGRRGTASAIALALRQLAGRIADADIVAILWADSLIPEREEFKRTMQAWNAAAAETERIVSLGVRPTYPSTGLGYINSGKRLMRSSGFDVFETVQFVEKPNESTAKAYAESGSYFWNTGMFAARFGVLRSELERHMPDLMRILEEAIPDPATHDPDRLKPAYLKLPDETIDYGLFEKSDRLAVLPASFSWADVGSWADLHDVLEHDEHDNVFEGEYVDIDTKSCFVYSPDRLVATIGVENLVIINTKDAILICPKDRSQDVKKVVAKLKERGQTKFL